MKPFVCSLAIIPILVNALSAWAQTVEANLWVTDGPVNAIAVTNGTVYIGGRFEQVGPSTGGGVTLDGVTGALPPSFPRVTGEVHAVVADGAGGWYIGGAFTHVGGLPRSNLANVTDALRVEAWNPGADAPVRALEMNGSTLYVAGDFISIGGAVRHFVASFDVATGALADWDRDANDPVVSLATVGSTVYAGGSFIAIGGAVRHHLAALDLASGTLTPWAPYVDDRVRALAVGGSTVYAGGVYFFQLDAAGTKRTRKVVMLRDE